MESCFESFHYFQGGIHGLIGERVQSHATKVSKSGGAFATSIMRVPAVVTLPTRVPATTLRGEAVTYFLAQVRVSPSRLIIM